MVVMVKVPLSVVGVPSYMYCMLFCTVLVREALRSIFRFLTGSSVMRSCRSLVVLLAAGVAMVSFTRSQSLRRALSI